MVVGGVGGVVYGGVVGGVCGGGGVGSGDVADAGDAAGTTVADDTATGAGAAAANVGVAVQWVWLLVLLSTSAWLVLVGLLAALVLLPTSPMVAAVCVVWVVVLHGVSLSAVVAGWC